MISIFVFSSWLFERKRPILYLLPCGFFQLIPGLRELRLSGFAKCSDCVKTILKCFPKLEELWIRGTCLKLRSDYELISQMKSLTKLSINVGGPNCLEPLTNLTELRSLYVESIFSYISPIEIIEIIKKCKKLQFLFCYYINHGEQPHDSIANIFKSIRSTRDPNHQTPFNCTHIWIHHCVKKM